MRRFRNERAANAYRDRLDDKLQETLNKGRRPISSVLSEGQYQAHIYGDLAPKFFPEERPRYE